MSPKICMVRASILIAIMKNGSSLGAWNECETVHGMSVDNRTDCWNCGSREPQVISKNPMIMQKDKHDRYLSDEELVLSQAKTDL